MPINKTLEKGLKTGLMESLINSSKSTNPEQSADISAVADLPCSAKETLFPRAFHFEISDKLMQKLAFLLLLKKIQFIFLEISPL